MPRGASYAQEGREKLAHGKRKSQKYGLIALGE